MAHTNSTPNLQLAQFIGTDKPTWLGDWNSTMLTIDNAVGGAQENISTITGALETITQALTTLTNEINGVKPGNVGTVGDYLVKTESGQEWQQLGNATTSKSGLMTAADKTKLDGIAANANKYTLPTASSSTLGGVKVGTGLSISNGVLSATQLKTTYGSQELGSFSANQGKNVTITDGKPTGTILGCIPIGSRPASLHVQGSQGSSIGNNKAGKFYVSSSSAQTSTHLDVLWLYY